MANKWSEYRNEVRDAFEADYAGHPCNEDMVKLIELGVRLGLEAAAKQVESMPMRCSAPDAMFTDKQVENCMLATAARASIEIRAIDPRAVLLAGEGKS